MATDLCIAICGPGEAGKDVTAAWLATHCGLGARFSTSKAAAHVVWELWGKNFYEDLDACYADRRNHRATWADIIWDYNKPDGMRLYREMIAAGDRILIGIRKAGELQACRAAGLIQLTVYIERPGAAEGRDSNQIVPADCDFTVHNDSDLPGLYVKLGRIFPALIDGLRRRPL